MPDWFPFGPSSALRSHLYPHEHPLHLPESARPKRSTGSAWRMASERWPKKPPAGELLAFGLAGSTYRSTPIIMSSAPPPKENQGRPSDSCLVEKEKSERCFCFSAAARCKSSRTQRPLCPCPTGCDSKNRNQKKHLGIWRQACVTPAVKF